MLVTARFDRMMNPSYGAGVPEFVYSPIRSVLLSTRAEEIKAYLNAYITLAEVVLVTLSELRGAQSTLSLDVQYTISPSSQVFSMQRTVTGIVTDESFGAIL